MKNKGNKGKNKGIVSLVGGGLILASIVVFLVGAAIVYSLYSDSRGGVVATDGGVTTTSTPSSNNPDFEIILSRAVQYNNGSVGNFIRIPIDRIRYGVPILVAETFYPAGGNAPSSIHIVELLWRIDVKNTGGVPLTHVTPSFGGSKPPLIDYPSMPNPASWSDDIGHNTKSVGVGETKSWSGKTMVASNQGHFELTVIITAVPQTGQNFQKKLIYDFDIQP